MKLRNLLLLVLFLNCLLVPAQKKISIDRISAAKPVDVVMPLMVDSVNMKGNKFQYKDLLETFVSYPKLEFVDVLSADVMKEYFYFSKPQTGGRFQLLSFQVTANRNTEAKLKVTSPGLFEVYVNGKKEFSKTTIEDSLHLAKMQEKKATLSIGTNTVFIKYLTLSSNIATEAIRVVIEQNETDTLTTLKISNDAKRLIRIEDILVGSRISSTKISPDGRFVLIDYRDVDNEGKITFYTELVDTKTQQSTYLGIMNTNWMPRSNKFYYTVKRASSLHLIAVDPQTFTQQTISKDVPPESFYFSNDETFLLIRDKETNDERKGDLKLLASPEDRQAGYLDRSFIFKYDLSTGVKSRLTFGKHSTVLNDISSDSKYLLFSTGEETITERPFRTSSMFCLDILSMQIDTLWVNEPFAYSAIFSPDGKRILITGAPEAFKGIGLNIKDNEIANSYDTQAFLMDLATKAIEPITKNFDPSVSETYWSKVDRMIYLRVVDRDFESIYRYNPQTKVYTKLELSEEVIRNFSLADNSLFASYFGLSSSNSTKAYSFDIRNGKSTLISNPLADVMNTIDLGEMKDWNFTASDGTIISGRYYLPPNFDPLKKYPMIVYYYGGTTPTARTLDHPYPMHVYAAQGYVVYVIQPSGTIGFGQEFSARHVNAWGKRTADDIIEGTKLFVKEHPFVNENKIGCVGASYGGFMTMYLQTQTDIFAAAVSHAGISSLSSYWGEGYWGYTYSSGASANSYPWNNRELYIEQSPLFNADKIKTPLLLLHGTEDTNVPMGESIQMYTALKILGRPVEFIQVKGENHGIATFKRRIEWNNSIYAWFSKWLKDDSAWWDSLYKK